MDKLQGINITLHKKPKKLAFLLHGYGDYAENFIALATQFNDNNLKANFFAPNAPFAVPQYPLGRQWFNPYPNGMHYNEAGPEEKEIMQQECAKSIKQLEEYINNLCLEYNVFYEDCFIIGFSQGAMIVYELGNYIKEKFAGCIMISGRILSNHSINNNLFVKTPIMILHGDEDDIVSPDYFFEASKITKSKGFVVEDYLIKGEGHTISQTMLQLVNNFIKKNV